MSKLALRPFKEFWIDCLFNSYCSILTSIDKKYVDLTYLNCYKYVEKEDGPKGIGISNGCEIQSDVLNSIVSNKRVTLKDKTDVEMIEYIIDVLKENCLFIGVDLYEWIPGSICWERYHWEHYSMVTEYDADRDEFIVFDENLKGFDAHNIPRERFLSSIRGSTIDVDGFLVTVGDKPMDYKLELSSIKKNAIEVIKSIEDHLNKDNVWYLSPTNIELGDYFDLFSMFAFQIMNRQTANLKLMERMMQLNWIDQVTYDQLSEKILSIMDDWKVVKNIFVKGYVTFPRRLKIEKLRSIKNRAMMEEMDAWNIILQL